MKYVIYHPDGSLYDRLTLGEIQKAIQKGRITREYLAQPNGQTERQRVGVLLGLEQPGEEGLAHQTVPPPPGAASRTMTSQQSRGRWYLLIPLAGLLALQVTSGTLHVLRNGMAQLVPSAIGVFLSVALVAAVWSGIRWARGLLVGLLLGTGLYLGYSIFSRFIPLVMVFAVICLISGVVIGFSPSVSSFLSFQRTRK